MDIYTRAAAWATAFVMENELINDAVSWAGKRIDADSAKLLVSMANLIVPEIAGHLDPALKDTYEQVVSDLTESLIDYPIELRAEFTALREDGEKAAAAIEKLTAEADRAVEREPPKFEQEVADLKREFADELKERVDAIDTIEKAWLENHPDLDQKQRDDAEEKFGDIRKGELESLGSKQDARMEALVKFQQERHDDLGERKQELDETRDERS
jgi:hypothetical protein